MNNILINILNDLDNYKRDKKVLLKNYINERLNKSFQTYYSELTKSVNYLKTKNEIRVYRNINKDDSR